MWQTSQQFRFHCQPNDQVANSKLVSHDQFIWVKATDEHAAGLLGSASRSLWQELLVRAVWQPRQLLDDWVEQYLVVVELWLGLEDHRSAMGYPQCRWRLQGRAYIPWYRRGFREWRHGEASLRAMDNA